LKEGAQEPLIKSDVLRESAYREAVTKHSPGLPCFAATLGTELGNKSNPNGVVTCLVEMLKAYSNYGLETGCLLWMIQHCHSTTT
jgi:hypothetical protein